MDDEMFTKVNELLISFGKNSEAAGVAEDEKERLRYNEDRNRDYQMILELLRSQMVTYDAEKPI